jgi:DNA-directed RNA polymerase subunit RPC12/RpoP
MSYKCLDCGHIFEDGEQAHWSESRGEYWGTPCSENMSGCPLCKGEYEETVQCAVCGSEHLEDELNGGVCDECIDSHRYDIDMCFSVGANDTEGVEINCFLASMFDKEEVEEILFRELKEAQKYRKIDCEKFIESDRSWFAEILAKEVEKDENAKG